MSLKQPHSVHRCRYNKLHEIQQVVDETSVSLKRPHSVHRCRYNKLCEIQQVVDETPVALKQPHSVHRCRYNKLCEIQQVVDETSVALKQPHSVRLLSLDYAVDAINKSWASLVAVLGRKQLMTMQLPVGCLQWWINLLQIVQSFPVRHPGL